jgi:hypothetical protein
VIIYISPRLLPGQQGDELEVMEVQEMLGWLLFSDDH